jgi:hypothetical protein
MNRKEMQEKYNIPDNAIVFFDNEKPLVEFRENGDIVIKGEIVKNDSEVVDGMKVIAQNLSYPEIGKELLPFVDEVEEFNAIMGKPNNYTPVIPDEKEWMFVYNFILEELEEYKHACEQGDIVEVLDALCDIAYVSVGNGTMLHGLKDKLWPAYQEVQASNLSKACLSEEEAQETVRVRSAEQEEPCHYEKVDKYFIVYRTRDRKVMKSINYFRPDLTQFFK